MLTTAERRMKIELLNKLLTDDRDRMSGESMLLAMIEMYTLVTEELVIKKADLQNDITQIRSHRSMAITDGCDDDLLERANTLLWKASAADLELERQIKEFSGFIKELKAKQGD